MNPAVEALLRGMIDQKASDLHLRVGTPPVYRVNGTLLRAQMPPLSAQELQQIAQSLLTQKQSELFALNQELDFARGIPGVGRFRVNAFKQRNTPAFAIRATQTEVPAFGYLGLPDVLLDVSMKKRGLVLVTGTTGSGKSTLLASMINHVNANIPANIITIEDPIEYLFRDVRSTIVQREIGSDTQDFPSALRACFRQDPDILLIGEIRDTVTMETALSAADTGHLVMSTLHTMNCVETISRIISFFPPHQHEQIRLILSNVLVAIVSLRLLPRKDGRGRVPASEILINNAAIAEYILNPDKTHLILPAVREGFKQYGSRSFDQSLLQMYNDDLISIETAKQNASNPDDFELKVGGIEGTSDRSWNG